jgi:hypothetical protein
LNKLKTYLIQNPLTNEGRNFIKKYHGFTNEWNEVKRRHDDAAPVADKILVLVVFTLRRDPRTECISCGVKECIALGL